ncbi:bis(monoacylglycero)phosphate synthase CLN5-like [Tubulanus polymorphus]|uniref:bis(monoacylglycero)phosphate synthase CLN5-like n=1 Tax=Tubulanus polymorphus TaxID=672921 RepID=UPI003DA68173
MATTSWLLVLEIIFSVFCVCNCAVWPIPYQRYRERPKTDAFCQALYPFCPTGRKSNQMPVMLNDDLIEIYALKAPVWEFKFGSLLKNFHIMHDAIGFKSLKTGKNYTMEWYELFQLGNCTFPHVRSDKSLKWCNQGAACIYSGIDDIHWSQNGTLTEVGLVSGAMFNKFSDWVLWDNRTGIYYETWTVEEKPGGRMWFDSYDCASFVVRAFQQLKNVGAKFNRNVRLNYTRVHIYSEQPRFLGNTSQIFGPTGNKTLAADILRFYEDFQPHVPFWKTLLNILFAAEEIFIEKKFYLFYNFAYWILPIQKPYFGLTYTEVPLP